MGIGLFSLAQRQNTGKIVIGTYAGKTLGGEWKIVWGVFGNALLKQDPGLKHRQKVNVHLDARGNYLGYTP